MIKVKDRKILLLPGDGIGPEVIREVRKIIEWFNKNKSLDFKIEEGLVGGASYEKHKNPITDEVFYKALESEAVILGAVGGPKYDNLEFSKRPERALLKLRKELKLFANLRPAICFKQLVDASPLKPEIISGLDIMIVRELTGGIYFGEPRGIEPIENNERKGINTHSYTTSEIQRVARVAFDLAKKRKNKVTSCEKSNVMEAGVLWKEEVQALKGINLSVEKGEFLSIMGPSGSGKTTLMNIIGCLDTPTSGDYYLNNKLVNDLGDDELAFIRNKEIGFVFQSFHLLAKNSALNNVLLPLKYAGIKEDEANTRARDVLDKVGLTDRINHAPSELSGGQQQRVAIARALVNNPSIIFADEPTGNLDSQTGDDVMNLFKELNKQGQTIILITHEEDIAKQSKRIINIKDGLIESDNRV